MINKLNIIFAFLLVYKFYTEKLDEFLIDLLKVKKVFSSIKFTDKNKLINSNHSTTEQYSFNYSIVFIQLLDSRAIYPRVV